MHPSATAGTGADDQQVHLVISHATPGFWRRRLASVCASGCAGMHPSAGGTVRSIPPCSCELLQVANHPSLETCEQRYPPGGALEAGGSPHCQAGAIRLRLQQRIGGRGATIHCQFTQAGPEGLFSKLHQRRY